MTKPYLSLLIFLCIGFTATSQQWIKSPAPHFRRVNALVATGASTIIAAGGNLRNDSIQAAFKTSNQGLEWGINLDIIAPMINGIAFYDSLNGYAVCYNGKKLKTSDGGTNWVAAAAPLNRHFNAVAYANAQTIIVVGGRNTGNDTLQTIIKTVNGGSDWVTIIDQPGQWLTSVYFIDATTGFAVGTKGTILTTSNAGDSWQSVSSPVQHDLNSVYFSNSTTGFIAGGINSPSPQRTLLKTTDGGQNWVVQLNENRSWLRAVSFYNATNGYAVGDSAAVLYTTNSGQNWQTVTIPVAPDTTTFTCVLFTGSDFGIIGSAEGNFYTYSNLQLPQVIATGATVTNETDATMNGTINGYGNSFQYSFLFDTDSMLTNVSESLPVEVTNNSSLPYSFYIPGLLNDTIYYYCVKARNLSGTVYSDTIPFYTGAIYSVFEVDLPTQITATDARVNATVNQLAQPANLYFEYGTTSQFGSVMAATPAQITDAQLHHPYADLSGLQPNSYYYYRLKAVLPNGVEIISNTRYFYNGSNTIPNWDFELWDTVQTDLLNGWSFTGDNFEKVAGHSGNYALKLYDYQLGILGNINYEEQNDGPGFYGGTPYNYRPDSVSFYANYFIEPGDTAWMVLKLYSDAQSPVSQQFYPIPGNSSGQFQRLAFEINYNNSDMPDSVIIAFITTNPFDTLADPISIPNFLIIDDISFGDAAPTIFNYDFESWRTEEHHLLTSWGPHVYFENAGDEPFVSRVLSNGPNDYAMQLKSKYNSSGILLGVEASTDRTIFGDAPPGFSVNAQHNFLSGYYKYFPENNDTMTINIVLYKNREEIGSGVFESAEMVTDFTQFIVPIHYQIGLIPDSATIKIQCFNQYPRGESVLVIDKLVLDDPGIQVGAAEINGDNPAKTKIYPNPGIDKLTVLTTNNTGEPYTVELVSLTGSTLMQVNCNQQKCELNTENIPNGIFLIKVHHPTAIETFKWIKTNL